MRSLKQGKSLLAVAAGVLLLGAMKAEAKLVTSWVEYKEGNTILRGYLAYDDVLASRLVTRTTPIGFKERVRVRDSKEPNPKHPGVLIVHEWTGLGEYVQKRAEQLAGLGYVAFAADIYGKGVRPANPQEAGKEAGKYRADRALLRRRTQAGLKVLQDNALVDAKRIAAMGYCFGGGAVLELARSGADVAGVVSFHGNLDTPNPDDAKNIKGKVLVLHGANDPAVPPAQVAAFQEEMKNARVDYQFIAYGGAVHAFTNPAAGNDPTKTSAYDAKADRRSWQAMLQFYNEIFAPTGAK